MRFQDIDDLIVAGRIDAFLTSINRMAGKRSSRSDAKIFLDYALEQSRKLGVEHELLSAVDSGRYRYLRIEDGVAYVVVPSRRKPAVLMMTVIVLIAIVAAYAYTNIMEHPIEALHVNCDTSDVVVGSEYEVLVHVEPGYADVKDVTWHVDKPFVEYVVDGTVLRFTLNSSATAGDRFTVYAESKMYGLRDSMTFNVVNNATLNIVGGSSIVNAGQSFTLTAIVPSNYFSHVILWSVNNDVASCERTGKTSTIIVNTYSSSGDVFRVTATLSGTGISDSAIFTVGSSLAIELDASSDFVQPSIPFDVRASLNSDIGVTIGWTVDDPNVRFTIDGDRITIIPGKDMEEGSFFTVAASIPGSGISESRVFTVTATPTIGLYSDATDIEPGSTFEVFTSWSDEMLSPFSCSWSVVEGGARITDNGHTATVTVSDGAMYGEEILISLSLLGTNIGTVQTFTVDEVMDIVITEDSPVITIGPEVSKAEVSGMPNVVSKNPIVVNPRLTPLEITLRNVHIDCLSGSALHAGSSNGSTVTLVVEGDVSLAGASGPTPFEGLVADDLLLVLEGTLVVTGGTAVGAGSVKGADGILCDSLTIDGVGSLKVNGGDGSDGTDGSAGAWGADGISGPNNNPTDGYDGSHGGDGTRGGDGGIAINTESITVLSHVIVIATGGNGGDGGNGASGGNAGRGGAGANGYIPLIGGSNTIHAKDGGNGGHGGSGGDGGSGGLPCTVDFQHPDCMFRHGNGGNGGHGGSGGRGGDGGSTPNSHWFVVAVPDPSNGGDAGDGGNGGSGGRGGDGHIPGSGGFGGIAGSPGTRGIGSQVNDDAGLGGPWRGHGGYPGVSGLGGSPGSDGNTP